MAQETAAPYPLSLRGELHLGLNRWLWLVKWVLIIPHVILLAFLWIAVIVVYVIAFFAILLNGRYPRGLFDFNVGVLRWTWRVGFYSYSALGTDIYPPFSLHSADYPADLSLEYPERLNRGLVLTKWWRAIPHYFLILIFQGGFGSREGPGLISLLVIFAGVAMLFTKRYPRDIFEFVMGLNRWTYRVAAYALLMTDQYPPFRLDMRE
jgi:hypothetical protein